MTVVKTSNHHLYDVDASINSNGNEKDNMILHYHQNPSANIIKKNHIQAIIFNIFSTFLIPLFEMLRKHNAQIIEN